MRRVVIITLCVFFGLAVIAGRALQVSPPTPSVSGTHSASAAADKAIDFGRVSVVVRPLYGFIGFLDSSVHDIGISVFLFGILVYFGYSLLTYGYRQKLRD